MGRRKIDLDVLRPKLMINTTFNKRKDGLKNKAKELGILCGCEVALIIIPPKGCNNNEVIDLSVNGTIVEIFQKYSMIQQQNPGREQLVYIPQSPIPQSSSSVTEVQQPVQAKLERNEYAPSSSPGPQVQQPVQDSLEMNAYAPSMAHGVQTVFMNPNEHVGLSEQLAMQQMRRCLHHNMQNIQHGNLQHHIQQHGNILPLQHNNHVQVQHGNHIPPQQGHGTNYMFGTVAKRQRSNHHQQHNNMTALLHHQVQASAAGQAHHNEAAMSHSPSSGYAAFAPPTKSPDSDGTIDNAQLLS